MNKEKYEALSLATLKDLAKSRGIKGLSGARKQDIIEAMLKKDEEDKNADKSKLKKQEVKVSEEKKEVHTATEGNGKNKNFSNESKENEISKSNSMNHQNSNQKNSQFQSHNFKNTNYEMNTIRHQNYGVLGGYATKAEANAAFDAMMQQTGKYFVPMPGLESMEEVEALSSGITADGILELMPEKDFGFIRCDNYLPGTDDVYVSNSYIRRYNLKTGDILSGMTKKGNDKFRPLLYLTKVNNRPVSETATRANFEDLTPIFPNERIVLERSDAPLSMRLIDLIAPIGKGQRGMIVSPPKAGKTTLLKDIAKSVIKNNKDIHLMILLIDERPEEVTDMKEAMANSNADIIYSTFDELPENHRRVSEMVLERAKRLVEHGLDVMILVDSITRLTRAYNLLVPTSGRTLSGGLDPSALYRPKRFFGAARNVKEGGSLTILATALVDTGSKMDDVVYEEFKGTGNMELVLDRKLSERRIFPAIDIQKSSTRREDLLMRRQELEAVNIMRRGLNSSRAEESVESIINLLNKTLTNSEFIDKLCRQRNLF